MNKLSRNNWILIGIVAVALIGGGWWLMGSDVDTENENDDEEESAETNSSPIDVSPGSSTISNDESVSVSDQPARETVAVSSAKFTESGWIAIRDDRGWTLGATRFVAGTHSNVAVQLLRGTTAGERYQVLLYIDDGDGAFDLEKEILVTRSDGSVSGATFTAQ